MDERYGSEPFGYVVAELAGNLVGTVNILKRDITFAGTSIKLGGIGGVCVHEKHLRKGIATAMLQLAMTELKKTDCDIAYLCTDLASLSGLYGRVGFKALNRQSVSTGTSGKRYPAEDGMIAPVNSQEKFDLVMNSGEVFDLQGNDW